MDFEKFEITETLVLNCISQGLNTVELIIKKHSEQIEQNIVDALTSLVARNILVFDTKSKIYKYVESFDTDDLLILEGNLFLPVTIIRKPEENCIYVMRGTWYKLPLNTDIRRIIWNVEINQDSTKNNSNKTLIDMIASSVLKERKAKIAHNPNYDNIRNKIVPFSNGIGLLLNAIGDEITDVTMQFKIPMGSGFYRGFTVRSVIATKELLTELAKPVGERDFLSNIKINRLFNLSDFMFAKNEIPVNILKENGLQKIEFLRITGVKKGYEFGFYSIIELGSQKKIETESFNDAKLAIERFKEIFASCALNILEKLDIEVDLNL